MSSMVCADTKMSWHSIYKPTLLHLAFLFILSALYLLLYLSAQVVDVAARPDGQYGAARCSKAYAIFS